jgi:transposase
VGHHAKKKTVHASEQQRPDVKAQRDGWFARLLDACDGDVRRLLFLDETGANTDMVRTYGRSAEGERCVGSAPGGHWLTVTGVAAIRLDGLTAAATMTHAMDGDSFPVYVTHALVPNLRPGDVVAMDNLPGHKLAQVRDLIEAAGAKLLYLPPYSPDFNPIEMIWSKVKGLLRSIAARTIDTLGDAFETAFTAVTLSDIQNCFEHCGYKL